MLYNAFENPSNTRYGIRIGGYITGPDLGFVMMYVSVANFSKGNWIIP